MDNFTIYGIKERNADKFLYIGYMKDGVTNGLTRAVARFIGLDIICLTLQTFKTEKFEEARSICNQHRIVNGFNEPRSSFGEEFYKEPTLIEFDLPAPSPYLEARRLKSKIGNEKYFQFRAEQKALKRLSRPSAVRRNKVRFVITHQPGDPNGFVRFVPILREGFPTWQCELVFP